nr:hypothetical protein Iba_chr09fCG13370 [Ipomoea batatas]
MGSFTVSSYDWVINAVETYLDGPTGPSRSAGDNPVNRPKPAIAEDEPQPVTEPLVLEEVGTSSRGRATPIVDVLRKHGDDPSIALLSKICAAAQKHQRVVYQPGLGEDNTGSDNTMQIEVQTALEASVDEDDLPKLLGVLPEEVQEPRLAPFSDEAAGQALEKYSEQKKGDD